MYSDRYLKILNDLLFRKVNNVFFINSNYLYNFNTFYKLREIYILAKNNILIKFFFFKSTESKSFQMNN